MFPSSLVFPLAGIILRSPPSAESILILLSAGQIHFLGTLPPSELVLRYLFSVSSLVIHLFGVCYLLSNIMEYPSGG